MTTTDPPKAQTKKLNVRVSKRGFDLIVEKATAADITHAHMTRRMLTFAAEHMPVRFVPSRSGRQGVKEKKLSVRVTDRGLALIDERAAAADIFRSHMARRMLAYAAEHMPAGFIPGRDQRRQRPA